LRDGKLPDDRQKARQIRMRFTRYTWAGNTLYKRGYTLPFLKCLAKAEADYVMREIHEGVCGSHGGSQMLAHKAVRVRYYWPIMNKDSDDIVRHCNKCQTFAKITTNPPEELNPISALWPFAQWGVDLVGPLPTGKGGCRFIVVAVDYFTKWAEVEALATITTRNIQSFLWKSVVCRYGIPHAFVTENGKQFDCEPFRKWCAKLCIRNYYSSPGHPQANRLVEATNKTLMNTLKKKLEGRKGAWVEFHLEVLWSFRTTTRTPTGETPFALTYGTEAIIPVEVRSVSYRVEHYNPRLNEEGMRLHLDLLQEK
jgi:hypothetical protein